MAVINFTPTQKEKYPVPVPENKKFKLLFNSDNQKFGGSDATFNVFKTSRYKSKTAQNGTNNSNKCEDKKISESAQSTTMEFDFHTPAFRELCYLNHKINYRRMI